MGVASVAEGLMHPPVKRKTKGSSPFRGVAEVTKWANVLGLDPSVDSGFAGSNPVFRIQGIGGVANAPDLRQG